MINISMQPTQTPALSPRIAVIGVGGAGGNAVNNMISSNLEGCEFLVCNTDAQALDKSLSVTKVQLGETVTGGLGAGSKPDVGRAAAEESLEEVIKHLEGANMAFITAGMGGGTGTGAAPVIAKACQERGILTVGVVTKPFHFEGAHRMKSADAGIEALQDYVDTLIVIPNQNLFRIANENTTFAEAFEMADSVLQAGVRGVTDLMVRPGLVNLDFADIRTAMQEKGKAMMGTGEAEGDKRAIEAAEAAINNPLLDDVSMKGAHGVIINVTGGYDMTLFEADEACNRIRDEVDPEANIIFGATFDDSLDGKMRVSIVATGIEKEKEAKERTGGTGSTGFERAQPNTQASTQNTPSSRPPVFVSAKTVQGIKAPTPAEQIIAKQQNAAAIPPETGLDMFEQGEFADMDTPEGEQTVPRNTILRGTRYNDAFIPPKPIEAPSGAASHISSFHGAHVPEAQPAMSQAQTQTAAPSYAPSYTQSENAGLALNPPKAPVPTQKHSPSLFERIAGSMQEHLGGLTDSLGARPAVQQPKQRIAPSAPVSSPQAPSQGSLNIGAPSKPSSSGSDDQLDIPAFLRRQAN